MRKLIAANWKMNGLRANSTDLVKSIVANASSASFKLPDILLCPPSLLISNVIEYCRQSEVMVGGQDCHWNKSGAHTGDVSPLLLSDFGCSHVILGHSERRSDHLESNAVVRKKSDSAINSGLIPIICLGEAKSERQSAQTEAVLQKQISESLPNIQSRLSFVIAYEPLWAIGTGEVPTLEEIKETHAFIRNAVSKIYGTSDDLRILYGGSVKPSNSGEILSIEGVDGALVGGASLSQDDFWQIIESCD